MRDSILLNEIQDQPAVVSRLLQNEKGKISKIVDAINGRFSYIYIAARGSSDNAARYAQYLFGIRNQIIVGLATPSIFTLYGGSPSLADALVIGISQSGQSPDIISVIENAKSQGCPTIAITNAPTSPLASKAEFVINLCAGDEKAIAATKTYTSSLTALSMLSVCLSGQTNEFEQLDLLPTWLEAVVGNTENLLSRVVRYRYMDQCCVLGRGYNYSTSFEISLKIKEINRIAAEPYSTADFRHGPISTIMPGFPVIVIAMPGPTYIDTMNLVSDLDKRGAETILITSQEIPNKQPYLHFLIPEECPEWLSPILSVIPGQMFAMQLAIERGLNPDFPAGLSKVTQTY